MKRHARDVVPPSDQIGKSHNERMKEKIYSLSISMLLVNRNDSLKLSHFRLPSSFVYFQTSCLLYRILIKSKWNFDSKKKLLLVCHFHCWLASPLLNIHYLEQRKQEAEKIRTKYPERIPVRKDFPTYSQRTNVDYLGCCRTSTEISNTWNW